VTEPQGLLAEVLTTDTALLATFGIELVAAGDGSVVLAATPPADLVNSHGIVHGALVFALADPAAAYALATREVHPVTIGSSVTADSRVTAVAEVVTLGRSLATVRVEMTAEGRIAAHGTIQFALVGTEPG
jgi:uncharacterized protein (TIGR00369 family)